MSEGYVVVLEREGNGYGAYSPDLPGCVAVGESLEETVRLMREAVIQHVTAMRRAGDRVPPPTTRLGAPDLELPATAVGIVELELTPLAA